jgi:hypothetical protein
LIGHVMFLVAMTGMEFMENSILLRLCMFLSLPQKKSAMFIFVKCGNSITNVINWMRVLFGALFDMLM